MQEVHAPFSSRIRTLIERLPEPVIALSILEGWTEGRVYVDDALNPRVVFVWEIKNNLFLSGEPSREVADQMEEILRDTVIPYGELTRKPMSFFAYDPIGWSDYMPSILRTRPPIPDQRMCYSMDPRQDVAMEGLSALAVSPDGCELRRVDRALLEGADPENNLANCVVSNVVNNVVKNPVNTLENLDEVRSEILKQWNSLDDFFAKGFGYCLIYWLDGTLGGAASDRVGTDEKASGKVASDGVALERVALEREASDGASPRGVVTSWCLTEYPAGDEISIGVETVEEHQKKGHGTAVSAATIRECVQRGITPYWDLWLSNTPSKALAEKTGLQRKVTYPVVFFWYNEVDNLLVNANVAHRRDKRPDLAVQWYERAFAAAQSEDAKGGLMLSGTPGSRRWSANAAEACFKAGLREQARSYLNAAKRSGLSEEKAAELLEQWAAETTGAD